PQAGVDDLVGWPLGGEDDDDACRAPACDQVADEGGEVFAFGFLADGGGEVGVLVDDDEVDRLAAGGGDLWLARGWQRAGRGGREVLQPAHAIEGVGHGRADEPVGAVAPRAELDLLAVNQDEAAVAG